MFDRTLKILDESIYNKIINNKILLVGVGGVGGNALEALVRFGFRDITIIDNDIIDISNINRQIISNNSNIGNSKVLEACKRYIDINPNIILKPVEMFLTKDNINTLDTDFNYIIDACDTITTKIELIKYSIDNNIKIITCLGTGNRFDPTKLEISNISKTSGDPLARVMRKLLKDNNISNKIPCIWSKELPVKIDGRTPGSTSLVPSVAGIYCASYIVNDIKNKTI